MRAVILGLDCEGQSFDRPKMESGHALGVITFGFQPGQIKTVRTEDQIGNWKNQGRRLPASFLVDKLYDSRNRGSKQVVGKRPKVTLGPNLPQRLLLGKRDHARYRSGVQDEKC